MHVPHLLAVSFLHSLGNPGRSQSFTSIKRSVASALFRGALQPLGSGVALDVIACAAIESRHPINTTTPGASVRRSYYSPAAAAATAFRSRRLLYLFPSFLHLEAEDMPRQVDRSLSIFVEERRARGGVTAADSSVFKRRLKW